MRALAISLAGRLAPRNPAYVLPALRNHLQQLLADMERSPDSRQREGPPAGNTDTWLSPVMHSTAAVKGTETSEHARSGESLSFHAWQRLWVLREFPWHP